MKERGRTEMSSSRERKIENKQKSENTEQELKEEGKVEIEKEEKQGLRNGWSFLIMIFLVDILTGI